MNLRKVLRKPYNQYLRNRLPRKIGVYNGVAVRFPRFLDLDDHTPDWKAGTVGSVKTAVAEGDIVVEIGSGFGVCTVWAARKTRDSGSVVTYEASADRYEVLLETLDLNGVSDRIETHHALVGEEVDVFGSMGDVKRVHPEELPNPDVFITDCEGAELNLLNQLDNQSGFSPRSMVIETHGFAGSSTEDVCERLEKMGYRIVNTEPASPYSKEGEDNQVVTATND